MKNACNCGRKVEIQYGPNGKPKAMLIWLCVDELFRTDGTTTYIPDVRDVPRSLPEERLMSGSAGVRCGGAGWWFWRRFWFWWVGLRPTPPRLP